MGERSHNGTDGTPTGAVSGTESGSRRPLLIAVETLGWLRGGGGGRGHRFLIIGRLNFPESQMMILTIIPH